MSGSPRRVAIIGGGISGLSLAYYLQKFAAQAARPMEIELFERKAILGGNAETVWVDLGTLYRPGHEPESYVRWADLGVNDVNFATYRRLRAVMEEIGHLDEMKPLQNSESYFSRDGRFALTDDADLDNGVSDPAFRLDHADGGRLAPLIKVVHRAALDLLDDARITPRYTVGDFFDGCIADPRQTLQKAAKELEIDLDWEDPELPCRLEVVRNQIYYPRISAMYFADDRGPAGMPLQAPFEYYRVQEGGDPPDRRYFDKGAQYWLEVLASHVVSPARQGPKVQIHRNVAIEVQVASGKVAIGGIPVADRDATETRDYDLAIMATHADNALDILEFGDGLGDVHHRLRRILDKVRYTRSFAVCHTASHRLPANRNLWRTYNIEVRDKEDTFFPYRIDYVANRHQNDMANPVQDRAGLPQYFVSLVDDLNRIPQRDMLDRHGGLGLEGIPELVRPGSGSDMHDSGYKAELAGLDGTLHRKAWTYFKHNVLDADCIEAQQEIDIWNLDTTAALAAGVETCPLLFAGGWTRGAGLQEQCLEQSERLATLLLGHHR
ncbi:FAD-dependent oxidoreductase [Billgrantia endophytica]|uniref:FAD-dependent oxidoreductase n=1 Tax=Billgrantia endophytica TaxID=2033802 RepID=A0A2N7U7N9_9GAMM|nr:FAD-dependent oxidoreductase [Halomonas endophytica]PMR76452.1 FAD-dependent oxidoreductase [Halomonas endophytica]